MSYRPHASSGAGALVALLLLALMFMLAVGAAGFVWVRASPAPATAGGGGTAPMSPGTGSARAPAPQHASYQVRAKSCVRLAGDCQVILGLTQVGEGTISQFALAVSTADGQQCPLQSPPLTAPFPQSVDVVVLVPEAACRDKSIRLQLSTKVSGRTGYLGTYGASQSTTLEVATPRDDREAAKSPE